MLSNSGMPPSSSNITNTAVIATYIRYNTLVELDIFAVSLPTAGPGLSALSRCMLSPLPLDSGTMASMNTSTPMPPIQCVNERQYSRLRESPSIFVSIVAPVVVKPETVSNTASR